MGHRLYANLKWAVSHGQREQIDSLLQKGAPVNLPLDLYEHRSPLLSSVYVGDLEIVERLLRAGASVNEQNINGETALTLAAKFEKHAIVDLLLATEGLKNVQNNEKFFHLHIACMRNNLGVVRKLIQSKKDVNAAVDNQSLYWPGFTALHFAVQFRCIKIVEYLLSIGADLTIKDARQLTPLHLADMQRNEQIIDMILQAHTNFVSNPKNSNFLSHFHIACTRNNVEVVEFFIQMGVDFRYCIDGTNFSDFTALDLAIYYECIDVVKLLLLHGDHLKSDYPEPFDRIEDAYDSGGVELVNLLLSKNELSMANFSKIEEIPKLHISLLSDGLQTIQKALCEVSNSLNAPLWYGSTPLHLAVERGDRTIIQFLADSEWGADYTSKNNQGESPLHLAFERSSEFVDLVLNDRTLSNGISKDVVNTYGLSHLHIFCASKAINDKKPFLIEQFIKLGSDVNSRVDSKSVFWPGFTPLHFAAQFRCDKVVPVLLANGACYSTVDSSNLSAFDLCIEKSYSAVTFERIQALKIMELILSFHSHHKLHPLNDHGYSTLHVLSADSESNLERMRDMIQENPSNLKQMISKLGTPLDGYTPLHYAMKFGNHKQANLLIEMGANVHAEDAHGDTPLHLAFDSDIRIEIKIPLSLFQDSEMLRRNPFGTTGYSLFHVACGIGDVELMNLFLQHGADVNIPTYLDYSEFRNKKPLHLVMRHNPVRSVEAVRLLLDNGADIHARDSKMSTALHNMRWNSHVEIIDILIRQGADVDALNANSETPLLRTCVDEDYDLGEAVNERISAFLNYGADINVTDEKGVTPFMPDDFRNYHDHARKTVDILMKHMLKLRTIGRYISEVNERRYNTVTDLGFNEVQYRDLCTGESERMLQVQIGNGATLRDILSKSLNELAVISENDVFVQVVGANDFLEKFPIYGPMLRSQLIKGQARRSILKNAQEALNSLIRMSLPHVCSEKIFQSFSNEELQFVILSRDT